MLITSSIRDKVNESVLDRIFESYIAEKLLPTEHKIPTEKQIIKAIQNRYYVGIYYEELSEDEDEKNKVKKGFRLIEPYAFGYGYKRGNDIYHEDRGYLRAFVIRDTAKDEDIKDKKNFTRRKSISKSKHVPYWRLFRLDRIGDWQLIPRKFSKHRELYNPQDKKIGDLISSIDLDEFSGESKI